MPVTAANLTTLWRILGDTADAQYPLYRRATAATATFVLSATGGATLLVHEDGSPLNAATRTVRWSAGFAAVALTGTTDVAAAEAAAEAAVAPSLSSQVLPKSLASTESQEPMLCTSTPLDTPA